MVAHMCLYYKDTLNKIDTYESDTYATIFKATSCARSWEPAGRRDEGDPHRRAGAPGLPLLFRAWTGSAARINLGSPRHPPPLRRRAGVASRRSRVGAWAVDPATGPVARAGPGRSRPGTRISSQPFAPGRGSLRSPVTISRLLLMNAGELQRATGKVSGRSPPYPPATWRGAAFRPPRGKAPRFT